MNESTWLVLISAVLNGAVTWGIITTKLAWMRRDLDDHHQRLTFLERKQ